MTGLKVVSLDPKAGAKADVVAMLKKCLADAEAGKLVDFSYAASHADGSITTGMTATEDSHRRLSAVSRLLHRLHCLSDDLMAPG